MSKNLVIYSSNDSIDIITEKLFNNISCYINTARQNVQRSIDSEMVQAYWLTGRDIVEVNQSGEVRAKYGIHLLKTLSQKLTQEHGRGFSVENLKRIRQFYIAFKDTFPIGYAVRIPNLKKL